MIKSCAVVVGEEPTARSVNRDRDGDQVGGQACECLGEGCLEVLPGIGLLEPHQSPTGWIAADDGPESRSVGHRLADDTSALLSELPRNPAIYLTGPLR